MHVNKRSQELFEEAKRLIPGGVNSPVRAFKSVGGEPVFVERGKGARVYDVDGNEYIDYVGSWGPLILGHAHPRIVEAVQRACERGTSFGAPTEMEIRLAEPAPAKWRVVVDPEGKVEEITEENNVFGRV